MEHESNYHNPYEGGDCRCHGCNRARHDERHNEIEED